MKEEFKSYRQLALEAIYLADSYKISICDAVECLTPAYNFYSRNQILDEVEVILAGFGAVGWYDCD